MRRSSSPLAAALFVLLGVVLVQHLENRRLEERVATLEVEHADLLDRVDKISDYLWGLDERVEEMDVSLGWLRRRAWGNERELERRFGKRGRGRLSFEGTRFSEFEDQFTTQTWMSAGRARGFRVWRLKEDSEAAAGGLRNRDVIISVNGHDLRQRDELVPLASLIGESCSLELGIRGEEVTRMLVWTCEAAGEPQPP